MATAYVPGPSLADAVDEHGPLHVDSVRALAAGLAEGLQAIHQAGLVHRDLKPSNVLLAADGPRVIDFGISRAVEGSRLTETGMLVGSPGFMSPEQARGLTVGQASDVFSLGAVLTFAATGEGPFGSGPTLGLMFRLVHEPPDLTRVPDELRPLVEACLAKEAADRPSPGQLLEFLSEAVGVLAPDWLPPSVTATFSQYAPVAQDPLSGPRSAARPEQASQPGAGYPTGSELQTTVDPSTQGSAPQTPVGPVRTTLGNTPAWASATQASAPTPPPGGGATGPWAPGPASPDSGATNVLQSPAPARRGGLRKRWLLVAAASVAGVAILAGVATAVTRSSGGTHTVNTGQTTPAPNSSPSLDATATATATPTPTPTATVAPTYVAPTRTRTTTSPTPTSSWTPTSTATPTTTATPTATSTVTTAPTPTAAPSSTSGGGCSSGCTQSPAAPAATSS
jgi:serine/threonine protein kinase